jgi:hypothetical protein
MSALDDLRGRLSDIQTTVGVIDVRTAAMAELLEIADAEISDEVDDVEPPPWVRRPRPPEE